MLESCESFKRAMSHYHDKNDISTFVESGSTRPVSASSLDSSIRPQFPESHLYDDEKPSPDVSVHSLPRDTWFEKFIYYSSKVDSLGVELRGIQRIPLDERKKADTKAFIDISLFWICACGGLTSMQGMMLGPLAFGLSLKDSLVSGLLGVFLGSGWQPMELLSDPVRDSDSLWEPESLPAGGPPRCLPCCPSLEAWDGQLSTAWSEDKFWAP